MFDMWLKLVNWDQYYKLKNIWVVLHKSIYTLSIYFVYDMLSSLFY